MPALLVTIGIKTEKIHSRCSKDLANLKEIEPDITYSDRNIYMTKYKRTKDVGQNFFDNEEYLIFYAGSMIFKGISDSSLLRCFYRDLKSNSIETLTNNLDGFFTLVIWSKKNKKLLVVTDHAGIMNTYIFNQGNKVVLSTSAMAISRNNKVTLDLESVYQYLRTSFICNSKTIYKEISLLEPASIYEFDLNPDKMQTKKYWTNPVKIDETSTIEKNVNELSRSLRESLLLYRTTNFCCDLTAGYDSRLILSSCLANKSRYNGLNAFVFGPENSPEVKKVKIYAKRLDLNLDHLLLPLNWNEIFWDYVLRAQNITDGEDNSFLYAPILFAQDYKSTRFDVSVNGLGGELYRDFWWIQELRYVKKKANYKRLINSRVLQYEYNYNIFSNNGNKIRNMIEDFLYDRFSSTNSDIDIHHSYNTIQIDNIYFRQKIRRWAGRAISSSNTIVPTIAPLTFKKNLEIVMSIHPSLKRSGKLVRKVIMNNSKEFAKLPMLNGSPAEPLNISNFYKFTPYVLDLSRKIIRKTSQNLFGKTVLLDPALTYNSNIWWKFILQRDHVKDYINYNKMACSFLFKKNEWREFINNALHSNFPYYSQLGTIMTLEMRLRQDQFNLS